MNRRLPHRKDPAVTAGACKKKKGPGRSARTPHRGTMTIGPDTKGRPMNGIPLPWQIVIVLSVIAGIAVVLTVLARDGRPGGRARKTRH